MVRLPLTQSIGLLVGSVREILPLFLDKLSAIRSIAFYRSEPIGLIADSLSIKIIRSESISSLLPYLMSWAICFTNFCLCFNFSLYILLLEKHKVILHELSFEDHGHRLKAPELLCPVFLAVQDDEFGDEERKKKQRMSQSIDDLCEMISEDSDDDQGICLGACVFS